MIYGLYCVRDCKTVWFAPTSEMNDEAAIRNFAFACRNTDSLFFTNPVDYSLWHVANWNPNDGEIIPIEPEMIADALQFVRKDNE